MAEHTLAILVKAVGTAQAAKNLKGVDQVVSNIGAHAGKGLRTAASNMLKLGATAAAVGAGLGVIAVKAGVQSLATLESAVTSVDGAIAQMGLTGKVAGANVASWANAIESDIGAAFDDKDITRATATLIRFGKVTPGNLKPAMVVMTDLAVKTGSVDSAAALLSKALAAPAKASGKLARAGVILTRAQQKQIEAFVKAGKKGEAQKVILDALAKSTKGAAAASQGPYQRAMSTMADVTEDAQRALAEGFLPVLTRASEWLKTKLADPGTMSNIRTLGDNLAGAFDKALTFVQGIDWNSLGAGLQVAADWAGKLFGAFMSMPPEVKGTILALAGLDRLSGGAVSGIVGELGKGLIKGVLGMTAGVVNINAGVVKGGGSGPGVDVGKKVADEGLAGALKQIPVVGMLAAQMMAMKPSKDDPFFQSSKNRFDKTDYKTGVQNITSTTETSGSKVAGRIERVTSAGAMATAAASRMAGATAAMASMASASRVVGAIAANRPVVTTNVYVSIPGASVRYGSSTGSAGGRVRGGGWGP